MEGVVHDPLDGEGALLAFLEPLESVREGIFQVGGGRGGRGMKGGGGGV